VLRHDCVLVICIISLTERALACAEHVETSALPSREDRIPAERNFCSFRSSRATDNLAAHLHLRHYATRLAAARSSIS